MVNEFITNLRSAGRVQFASILEEHATSSLKEYSEGLYDYSPPCLMEPILRQAFQYELCRVGTASPLQGQVLQMLEEKRVLQTSTHVTLSEGPTFLAIHFLSTLGLSLETPYVVAAFSGVPFSNAAWSGCLNYGSQYSLPDLMNSKAPEFHKLLKAEKDRGRDSSEGRLMMIPGKQRDGLVYQSPLSDVMSARYPWLTAEIQSVIPYDPEENDFTRLALKSNVLTHQSWCPNPLVFLDLNEIINHYLKLALESDSHLIQNVFFEKTIQKEFCQLFHDQALFVMPIEHKKQQRIDAFVLKNQQLVGRHSEIPVHQLKDHLDTGRLCATPFLSFLVLAFLNGFKCLGSFQQIEYLEEFKKKLSFFSSMDSRGFSSVPTNGLTTGRMLSDLGEPLYPLDLVMGADWPKKIPSSFLEFVTPQLKRLLPE